MQVERYVTGLDQPEPVGVAAILEKPVLGRERDVAGGLRQRTQLVSGDAAQEGMGG
jgi:hypothetical protein